MHVFVLLLTYWILTPLHSWWTRTTTECHFLRSLAYFLAVSYMRPIDFRAPWFPQSLADSSLKLGGAPQEGVFQSVCPIQRHLLLLIWMRIGSWLALSHSLVFGTLLNHFKFNWKIGRKHLGPYSLKFLFLEFCSFLWMILRVTIFKIWNVLKSLQFCPI